MLGQVFSFPSRPWLSALPLGAPSHPPISGPARSPTSVDAESSAVCASSWNSRRVTHRGSNQDKCFCDVPGLPPPNGAALPLQRGGLCEAHKPGAGLKGARPCLNKLGAGLK